MTILWEEPFGIFKAEAMACGTPVLGLCRGALPWVVKDVVTGFVCDRLEDLMRVAEDLSTLKRTACRKRVEQLYSDDAVVDAYEALYNLRIDKKTSVPNSK